jgi:8-oxo-dGTP diphosphatase
LYTFGSVGRDPRERVVTVAYYALVNLNEHQIASSTDARNAAWFSVYDIPSLAFDHAEILENAHERLRGKIRYQPIGFELLPEKFSLTQLQRLYEKILDRPIDKRNFRKKILKMDILEELDEVETDVAHRAARLYRFDQTKYTEQVRVGFNFEL